MTAVWSDGVRSSFLARKRMDNTLILELKRWKLRFRDSDMDWFSQGAWWERVKWWERESWAWTPKCATSSWRHSKCVRCRFMPSFEADVGNLCLFPFCSRSYWPFRVFLYPRYRDAWIGSRCLSKVFCPSGEILSPFVFVLRSGKTFFVMRSLPPRLSSLWVYLDCLLCLMKSYINGMVALIDLPRVFRTTGGDSKAYRWRSIFWGDSLYSYASGTTITRDGICHLCILGSRWSRPSQSYLQGPTWDVLESCMAKCWPWIVPRAGRRTG